ASRRPPLTLLRTGHRQAPQGADIHSGSRYGSRSQLPLKTALGLLRVVLKHEGYKMSDPHLWIDGPRPASPPSIPGYHSYGLAYVNNTQGHYSVNIFTGDVWQTESCTRYIFPALSRMQRRISERSGKKLLSDEEARSEVGCLAGSP
ncbi:hypothetical protein, partial [Massilia genomosp. 1]|uniref:hypothetical protein n=1 Tax=Massilia genomosp. 1 TaxID=2609280 RepID=UPI001C9E27A2